ncbi:MAG: Hpt domain-containing protein [Ginsengibacter sp.]
MINENLHEGKLFDLSLLEIMDDNEYSAELLTLFLKNTPVLMNELRKTCTTNDYDAIYKIAHKLKSSAGLFYANNLLDALTKIEGCAKAGINKDFRLLAAEANEEYKLIEAPLKEHLKIIQKELNIPA